MQILEAKNISKQYGTEDNPVHALNDVSLSIAEKELVAIIGKSGSGKSTLLHILGGLEHPTSGQVFYQGKDIYQMKDKELSAYRRKEIGFVFQSFSLIDELTALDNIRFPAVIDGKKCPVSEVMEITDALEITDRLKHRPGQMSGGQQQRTAIARALINHPAIILCDEPTGNLDVQSGEEVIKLLRRVVEEFNTSVVIVTHDSNIAGQADRIIEIVDGKIVE